MMRQYTHPYEPTRITFMSDHDRNQHTFGNFDTEEVREECRQQHVNFDSLRFFIPFVTVVWHSDKGRIDFAIMNEEPIREPREAEWITTSMDANDVDELLRHNGTYRTTNVFYRAQSGLSTLREDQRAKLGPPNDFRHNILMHKTTEHNVTGDITLLIGVPFISGRAHPVGYLRSPLIILRRVKGSAFPSIWMSISCQEV